MKRTGRGLLLGSMLLTGFPVGAVLPPRLAFPLEDGQQADVVKIEPVGDGRVRWVGIVPVEGTEYQLEVRCEGPEKTVSLFQRDAHGYLPMSYSMVLEGDRWVQWNVEGSGRFLPDNSIVPALAAEQFDLVCVPKT